MCTVTVQLWCVVASAGVKSLCYSFYYLLTLHLLPHFFFKRRLSTFPVFYCILASKDLPPFSSGGSKARRMWEMRKEERGRGGMLMGEGEGRGGLLFMGRKGAGRNKR